MTLTPRQFQALSVQEQGWAIERQGIDLGLETPEEPALLEGVADDELESLELVICRLFYLTAGFFVRWRYVSSTYASLGGVVVSDSRELTVFLSEVRLTSVGF